MKQIIKAIWKSNEIPYNGNFLWLKHEEGEFRLYTMGQNGWERLFKLQESPTTDSELNFIGTYTRSDLMNFTQEQWKNFLNQNFTFPMEDKNYFLKLGTSDLQDTVTLSFKDGRVIVYFPEPTDIMFKGFSYTVSDNKVSSVGTIMPVAFEDLVNTVIQENQSIMLRSDLSISNVLVYNIEPYEMFVGNMLFDTDLQGFEDWFDGHESYWEEIADNPTLLIFEGNNGINATAYIVYDTVYDEVWIHFTFAAHQVSLVQDNIHYNIIPRYIKYTVRFNSEYNNHTLYQKSKSLFDCDTGKLIEFNSLGRFYGDILKSGYTVSALNEFLDLVCSGEDYSDNDVYKYLTRLDTLVEWDAYKVINISFENVILKTSQVASGRLMLKFENGNEYAYLDSEEISGFIVDNNSGIRLQVNSKVTFKHKWEIGSLVSTILDQDSDDFATWSDNLRSLYWGAPHNIMVECKDGNMYVDGHGFGTYTIYDITFYPLVHNGSYVYYGCTFDSRGLADSKLLEFLTNDALQTSLDQTYLPLTAGEDKPLTNPLYCKSIYPTNTSSVIGYPDDSKKFTFYGRTINFQDYNYLSFERSTSFIGTPNTGMIDVTVKDVTAFLMEITIAGLSIYKFIVRKNTGSPAMSYVQVAGTPLPVRVGEITGDGKIHILIGEENTVLTEYTIVKLEMNCSNDGSSGGIYFATAFANNKKTTDYDSVSALANENP